VGNNKLTILDKVTIFSWYVILVLAGFFSGMKFLDWLFNLLSN